MQYFDDDTTPEEAHQQVFDLMKKDYRTWLLCHIAILDACRNFGALEILAQAASKYLEEIGRLISMSKVMEVVTYINSDTEIPVTTQEDLNKAKDEVMRLLTERKTDSGEIERKRKTFSEEEILEELGGLFKDLD